MAFSKKKIISVVLFLVILISIPLGMYLVKQTQTGRSRAGYENTSVVIGISDRDRSKIKKVGTYLWYWFDCAKGSSNKCTDSLYPYKPAGVEIGDAGDYNPRSLIWYKNQVRDMEYAGIDYVFPISMGQVPDNHKISIPGDPYGNFQYVPQSVLFDPNNGLVKALEDLESSLKVGLFYDSTSLGLEFNDIRDNSKIDASNYCLDESWHNSSGPNNIYINPCRVFKANIPSDNQLLFDLIYNRKIKDFFQQLPRKYWATHNGLSLEQGGRPVIIYFHVPSSMFDIGGNSDDEKARNVAGLLKLVKDQFKADFGVEPFFINNMFLYDAPLDRLGNSEAVDARLGWQGTGGSFKAVHRVNNQPEYVTAGLVPGGNGELLDESHTRVGRLKNPSFNIDVYAFAPRSKKVCQDEVHPVVGKRVNNSSSNPWDHSCNSKADEDSTTRLKDVFRNVIETEPNKPADLLIVEGWNELLEGTGIMRAKNWPIVDTRGNKGFNPATNKADDAVFMTELRRLVGFPDTYVPSLLINTHPASKPTVRATCTGGNADISVSWKGAAGNNHDYWVDVSENLMFTTFVNKNAGRGVSTNLNNLSLSSGNKYFVRVYNGVQSDPTEFTVPQCRNNANDPGRGGQITPGNANLGLPLDKISLSDGKIKMFGRPLYIRQAWEIISFGPTNASGYTPCNLKDSNTPLDSTNPNGPKIKVYPEVTCMTFGRENPEEYTQYPKILKQRGFNTIKITIRWDEFDTDGDGKIDDNRAFNNFKQLLAAARDEGIFINIFFNNYPTGLGGTPIAFFNRHPNAQAYGIPAKKDGSPALEQDPRPWTDCGYGSVGPNLNAHIKNNPGWPTDDQSSCDDYTGKNVEVFSKIPSIYNADYRSAVRSFIKDFLNKLGPDLASVLIYETSVEPMYQTMNFLDYSANAKEAFTQYARSNPAEAGVQGCLDSGNNLRWQMQGRNKVLCNNINYQIINQDSLWNKFRAKALADYINWEAQSIREGIKENLSQDNRWKNMAQELANRAVVAADFLDITPNTSDPTGEIRVLGNREEYIKNLKDINLIQVNWTYFNGPIPEIYDLVARYHPDWARSEHMSFDVLVSGIDKDPNALRVWRDNIFSKSTNFGIEFFHPRPVTADLIPSKFPANYINSFAMYDDNWDPKNGSGQHGWSFANISNALLTTGSNGRYLPEQVRDYYPPSTETNQPPTLISFDIGKDNDGYFIKATAFDNHLLDRYAFWAVKKSDDHSTAGNFIFLEPKSRSTYDASVYKFDQKIYFNTFGKRAVTEEQVTLDPNIEYDFILNTFDYAQNRCDFGVREKQAKAAPFADCTVNNAGVKTTSLASLGGGGGNNPSSPVPVVTPPSSPGGTASPVNRRPVGFFDGIENTSCKASGWAKDEDTPNQSVKIHVYKDVADDGSGGTWLAEFTAGEVRSDVGGNFGYNITLPLQDNRDHKIAIYGLDANGENNNTLLAGSPKTIHCPAPASVIQSIIQLFGGTGDQSQGDQNGDGKINELDFGSVYSK